MYSQNQSSLHPYSKENERVEVTSLKTKSSKRRMKEEEGKAALREGGGRERRGYETVWKGQRWNQITLHRYEETDDALKSDTVLYYVQTGLTMTGDAWELYRKGYMREEPAHCTYEMYMTYLWGLIEQSLFLPGVHYRHTVFRHHTRCEMTAMQNQQRFVSCSGADEDEIE